ncbi:MATE family efflux transporter [Sediminispirochaeta bajacaliforniensis]|uniref:MATE family efflux transporter n=1 Tax=Sediminispirochaeta bajacaliforniensis TaxID=148 RepID=UPI0003633587|nr:MATE family efflux transporter [Sediminispirochaeta bajacaliforniensis]
MNDKREMLLNQGMGKLFVSLALPGMAGMIVIGLYNLVDSIFVGQFVGPAAVSAVAMGYAVILVNQAILSLFATGASSLFSRAMGAGDQKTMDALLGNVFWPVTLCSLVLTVITFSFAPEILFALGAREEILSLGIDYLRLLSLGFVFGAVGPALNFLIRAEGQMKTAMKIMALGTITNIILDPIFIKVLGMGMEGAALATIIGQSLFLFGDFAHFKSKQSSINLSTKSFRITWPLMPEIIRVGFSGMIMSLAVAIQLSILLSLSSSYSINSNIVMSTAFRIMSFFYIPIFGISYGLQPVLGANYGAGRFDRVREAFWYFGKVASAIAVGIWLFFQLFAPFILSWFITDAEIVAEGSRQFRLFLSSFLFYGLIAVFIMLFMALGKAGKGALLTLGRQLFFFIPLALLLPYMFGEIGLWLSYPLGDLCVVLFGMILVRSELKLLKRPHYAGQ